MSTRIGTQNTVCCCCPGPTGPQGPTGPTGPQGPQGVQGQAGAQGTQGIQGPIGPQGEQGETGATGATGATGPAGPGVEDYDVTPVNQGIVYAPTGDPIFRLVIPIENGPNNSEDIYAHGIPAIIGVLEIRGALRLSGSGDVWPIPFVTNANDTSGQGNLTVRMDDSRVFLSSESDYSSASGQIIIDYF